MNRVETKARVSAANLNSPPNLRVLNREKAERRFAERVQTNQDRRGSEMTTKAN
jgi:hypothetical protein